MHTRRCPLALTLRRSPALLLAATLLAAPTPPARAGDRARTQHLACREQIATAQYAAALETCRQAVALHRKAGNRGAEAAALADWAQAEMGAGQSAAALKRLTTAAGIYAALGDHGSRAAVLQRHAEACALLGQFDRGRELQDQAVAAAKQGGSAEDQVALLQSAVTFALNAQQIADAERYLKDALFIAENLVDDERLLTELYMLKGLVAVNGGDQRGGIAAYKEAEELAAEVEDVPLLARVKLSLATAYQRQEDSEQARRYAQAIADLAAAHPKAFRPADPAEGEVLQAGLAAAQAELGQVDAAVKIYETLARESKLAVLRGQYLALAGQLLNRAGRAEEALGHFRQGLKLMARTGARIGEVEVRFAMAEALVGLGRRAEALPLLDQAIAGAEQTGNRKFLFRALGLRGAIRLGLGRLGPAEPDLLRAMDLAEALRGGLLGGAEARARFQLGTLMLYEAAIQLYVQQGKFTKAYEVLQRAKGRAFLDLMARADRPPPPRGRAGALLAEQRELRAAIDRQLAALLALGAPPAGSGAGLRGLTGPTSSRQVQAGRLQRELDELQARYRTLVARIHEQSPELASYAGVTTLSAAEIQRLLAPGQGLVEFYVGLERLAVFLIRPDSAKLHVILYEGPEYTSARVQAAVQSLRDAIQLSAHGADAGERARALTQALELGRSAHDVFLGKPGFQAALQGLDRLLIAPHGALNYLPWAALRDGEGRFLIERFALGVVPSGSTLKFIKDKERGRRRDPLTAFGNPVTSGDPLPAAEQEVRAVTAAVPGSRAVYGREATEAQVRAWAGDAGDLYFATHGILERRRPLSSRLLFTNGTGRGDDDGQLTVEEIQELQLGSSLVVMSACETGLGLTHGSLGQVARENQERRYPPGDELVGLTRAFLYAGAPAVISSLWAVADESTKALMIRVFAERRGEVTTDAALARAIRAQIRANGELRSPFFWAPFQLFGSGS